MSENRLQEALDILWCDPVANERARLERKIITAAKQWAEHPETPKPSSEDVPLYDAIIALIDFESSQ